MDKQEIVVIGGGAAGLMAAGIAAEDGADVTLYEKMRQPGRKLRITGKGRCNLTNIAPLADFISHYGNNGKFLRQAYSRFFAPDLIDFFRELGVDIKTERGGRVFPEGDDARLIVDALTGWVRKSGVIIKNNLPVSKILTHNNRAIGIMEEKEIYSDTVILATGGASYPGTGSTGDGYKFAKELGHTIIPVRPALAPIETTGNIAKQLQGLSLKNVEVSVIIDGRKKHKKFGDMIFTHFGLSGPIILTLSKFIVDALREKKTVTISIDLKPALDYQKLERRLLRDISKFGNREFHTLLKELLPRKLIPVCVNETAIPSDKLAHQITSQERKGLRLWLKEFKLEVSKYRPFSEAIITAGGIDLKEINPRTMESRLMPGLYFAGEILNIDGETGGYNLQAAFSTGWLAGKSAVEKPK